MLDSSDLSSFMTRPWISPWIVMLLAIYVFAIPWIGGAIVVRYWIDQDFESVLAGLGKTTARRSFMVAHMSLGAICIVLGPTQFLGVIRRRAPVFHRWSGRIYITSALLCAVCGLIFICLKGFVLVGGINMGLAFTMAGFVFALCAVETVRKARSQDFTSHRNWSIRAYSQVLSPMLYRYFYIILEVLSDYQLPEGNEKCNERDVCQEFLRTFDEVHAWTYFIFPLLVAELIIWCLPKVYQSTCQREEAKSEDKNSKDDAEEDDVDEEVCSGLPSNVTSDVKEEQFHYGWLNFLGLVGAVSCVATTTLIFTTCDVREV